MAEIRECYMCFGSHRSTDLICPCVCKSNGAPRWVHRQCLDRWRRNTSDSRYFTNCRECGFKYRFVTKMVENTSPEYRYEVNRRRKALGTITRHFLAAILGFQVVLGCLAMLVRIADTKEKLVEAFNFPQSSDAPPIGEGTYWDALYYRKITYYTCGFILFLFLFGIWVVMSQIYKQCRKYHRSSSSSSSTSRHVNRGTGINDCCRCDFWDMYCCMWATDVWCPDCHSCPNCCDACKESVTGVGDIGQGAGVDCSGCGDCKCGDCKCCDCKCDCGGGGGEVLLAPLAMFALGIAAVLAIAFIFVGIAAGIMVTVAFLHRMWQKFVQAVELRNLTEEFVVEDLSPIILNQVSYYNEEEQPQKPEPVPTVVGAVLSPEQAEMRPLNLVPCFVIPEPTEREKEVQTEAFAASQVIHGQKPWSLRAFQ